MKNLHSLQSTSSSKSSKLFHPIKKALFEIRRDKLLLLMFLPGLIYYIVFKYIPMYGIIIAFKDYNIFKGFAESAWVGLDNFKQFFSSPESFKIIKNTLLLNIYNLLFSFPAPILLALAFNEIKGKYFKKITQSITFLPHFISTVVIVGLVVNFLAPTSGIINILLQKMGMNTIDFFTDPKYFRTVYISMEIWKGIGWGSIIYLAALSGIDPALYEAAKMDGANKLKQTLHITLPSMLPTVVIMLILKLGHMMDVGSSTIILLYNPLIYDTADVLSTFVYRRGLVDTDYSFAAAVDLFTSFVGIILISISNFISRKTTESSLW